MDHPSAQVSVDSNIKASLWRTQKAMRFLALGSPEDGVVALAVRLRSRSMLVTAENAASP